MAIALYRVEHIPPVAPQTERWFDSGRQNVTCKPTKTRFYEGCSVYKGTDCARVIVDNFLSASEADALVRLAETAYQNTKGGAGPVSVFDGTSGATSMGDKFANVFALVRSVAGEAKRARDAATAAREGSAANAGVLEAAAVTAESKVKRFSAADLAVFDAVTTRFLGRVRDEFGVSGMMATSPSFIARLDSGRQARNSHDEYWHAHVDTKQCTSYPCHRFRGARACSC